MLTAFEKTLKLNFISNAQIIAIPRFTSKGRPAQGRLPDHFDYHIAGAIASKPQERIRRLQRQSCFILASNQLNWENLSNQQLIAAYKDPHQVEGAFRFLKDPLFMASTLFLNSPKRIMALMMIMTLSLLVYAALEHRIRQGLKTQNITFPNQKRQLVSNPTARWVFQFFSGIHVLTIQHAREFVLNLNDHQIALLNLLGEHYVKLYS